MLSATARASAYAKGWQTASREAISTALKILEGLDERSIEGLPMR
jgi:homoserine acetyltransferase